MSGAATPSPPASGCGTCRRCPPGDRPWSEKAPTRACVKLGNRSGSLTTERHRRVWSARTHRCRASGPRPRCAGPVPRCAGSRTPRTSAPAGSPNRSTSPRPGGTRHRTEFVIDVLRIRRHACLLPSDGYLPVGITPSRTGGRAATQRREAWGHDRVVAMTDVAWCDPERWGLDDMPLLVAEARARGDQQLEAEVLRRYGSRSDGRCARRHRRLFARWRARAGRGHGPLGGAARPPRRRRHRLRRGAAPFARQRWFAGVRPWHRVHLGDERVVKQYADRTLLLVWPTWNETWASDAVDAYHAAGGDRVVFVGEGPGGRTGDSGFHARLGETEACIVCTFGVATEACTCGVDADWTRTSRTTLPAWHGAETALHVYEPVHADDRRSSPRRRWRRR